MEDTDERKIERTGRRRGGEEIKTENKSRSTIRSSKKKRKENEIFAQREKK